MGKLSSVTFDNDVYKALKEIKRRRQSKGDDKASISGIVNSIVRNNPEVQEAIKKLTLV